MPCRGAGTSVLRSRQATRAPRSASNDAVARPMPEAPPVTMAFNPLNSVIPYSFVFSPARVDVDLRTRPFTRWSLPAQCGGHLVEADRRAHQRARIDGAV